MGGLQLFLYAISMATLNTDAVVRNGCDTDADEVGSLPAGAKVELRSALSGGAGKCYKVIAQVDGKEIIGYVPETKLKGADTFDKARRAGNSIGEAPVDPVAAPPASGPKPQATAANPAAPPLKQSPTASKMNALISSNQPGEALSLAEQHLMTSPKDALVLALAGLACYRMDNMERAREYWREAMEISPDPYIESLIKRAEREKSADKGSERKVGARVFLRYERDAVDPQLAQAMLGVLDEEYSRISAHLGCRAAEKVTAIVQSRQAYMQSTAAAEWSGGLYDGRIHVPVSASKQVDGRTRQVFAHELVHVCLSELGQWPAWLQEGLAQKYSGESVPPPVRGQVQAMIKAGQVPKLGQMGQTFARLSSQHAQAAYAIAAVAADRLVELTANTGIQNVLRNPSEFDRMTGEVERSLGL